MSSSPRREDLGTDRDALRVAVVGTGHLGSIHAKIWAAHQGATLVGVVDADQARAAQVAESAGCEVFSSTEALLGKVDAVSVVVPTKMHREVGCFFLDNGVDVLVEKPIARSSADGQAIVDAARRNDFILAVGHVERFNPALRGVTELGKTARYIESHRLAPFSFRSTDIGVVLDLMIHDLDLVLAFVQSPIKSVEAFGGAVFTPAEDMASAIIKYENGAVENSETTFDLDGKVDMPGSIDQVDFEIVPANGRRGTCDGDAAFLFKFHVVHGRARTSTMNFLHLMDSSGVEQHPLG